MTDDDILRMWVNTPRNRLGFVTDTDAISFSRRLLAEAQASAEPVAFVCADDFESLKKTGECTVYAEMQEFILMHALYQTPLYVAPQRTAAALGEVDPIQQMEEAGAACREGIADFAAATPETDAFSKKKLRTKQADGPSKKDYYAACDFARKLERERNDARATLEAERKAHDDLQRSIMDGSHPNLVLERKARLAAEAALEQSKRLYEITLQNEMRWMRLHEVAEARVRELEGKT